MKGNVDTILYKRAFVYAWQLNWSLIWLVIRSVILPLETLYQQMFESYHLVLVSAAIIEVNCLAESVALTHWITCEGQQTC